MFEAKDAANEPEFKQLSRQTNTNHGTSDPITQDTDADIGGFIEDEDRDFAWGDVGVLGWLCTLVFWVLAFVLFFQFFTRYFLNDSAVWTEEIARNILIILTFFGSALALQRNAHICVQYFVSRMSRSLQGYIYWFNTLLQSLFYAGAVYLCSEVASATQFQKLMAVNVSKSVIYQCVAIAFVVMLCIQLAQAWHKLRKGSEHVGNKGDNS
ncbi:TRAP transporter small permease [Enterovibrio sp. ZSDZ35]|uniref:TRAP transporter small permease protein n=1 Tax=Enterovibrio qingdaonensis TaxID=2899818 RepID=A0ABT5QRK8_9GAMM|nr:TRAP transporter small permease [Enterovibrio sp. ZSDZ35]MDD1783627.1 TRAP transporter small permease [Enterovibrio sp. ZSDZ35]